MMHRTKDELYILKLYEEACKQKEMETPFDRYKIGQLVGLQERGVNAICLLMIRANFIKKSGESDIYITPHGIKLALSLLEEHR